MIPAALLVWASVTGIQTAPTPPSASTAPPAPAVFTTATGGGGEVFVPEGARMIAAGRVTRVVPRPTGRYALAVREEPPPPDDPTAPSPSTELLLYDAQSGQVKTLLGQGAAEESETGRVFAGAVLFLGWVPGSDQALAVTEVRAVGVRQGDTAPAPTYSLYLIDAARGTARSLNSAAASAPPLVFISPRAPVALLRLSPEGEWRYLGERGTLAGPISNLPTGDEALPTHWNSEGSIAYMRSSPQTALAIDARTGKVIRLTTLPPPPSAVSELPAAALPVRLVRGAPAVATQSGATRSLRPLWLTASAGTDRPAFLAPDSSDVALLLGDAAAVLYTAGDDSALYARRLRRLSRAQYDKAQASLARTKALHDAFDIGQALLQYAEAHEGNLPPKGADLNALLAPYLKNGSALNGETPFVYEFAGGKIPTGGDPVRLGYIQTPSGRSAFFANGVSRWEQ